MADSGYGRALGVLGALAVEPSDAEDEGEIGRALAVIHDLEEGDGVDAALAVVESQPLSRTECLKKARAARGLANGVPKRVLQKIRKYNEQQACRKGDRRL